MVKPDVASEHDLFRGRQAAVALFCLAAAVAALAPRWTHGQGAKLVYGLFVAVALLAVTAVVRQSPGLRRFSELSFAFFVFSVVQVLNNTIPRYVATSVLHRPPVSGNPLASTVPATVAIQTLETLIAVVPIVVLMRVAGMDFSSMYLRGGKAGRVLRVSIIFFLIMCFLTARLPSHHVIKTHGTLTFDRVLSLAPALVAVAFMNGLQEELLFRGLFLRRYSDIFGPHVAIVLQAAVFAIAHVGITYSASSLFFIVGIVFPLGLLLGYVMQTTDGMVAPVLFHAGGDLPIYLAFFSYVR